MYESYYGFAEKPFSLTPDPKYLYRSESHASAFELLQYAIRRREGFVVITGDIGTGKTTICRALLEQIRILSNLETDKEKLLQVILVGQLELQTQLRSPELRQLDQRVSIRYALKPLDRDAVAAYITHRLTIAGASASVIFASEALDEVHRVSGGIPRLINLICDRALLAAFSVRTARILREHVVHAAASLDVEPRQERRQPPPVRRPRTLQPRASLFAAALLAFAAAVTAVAATAFLYQRFAVPVRPAAYTQNERGHQP